MSADVRMVQCAKLKQALPGLKEIPFDGHPLGERIYQEVSAEAWKQWVEHMKMLMNEYRLNLGNPEAQQFLLDQMEKYFFGEGAEKPPEYVPPSA
ncbi:MAG: oxidative damage protection protein [Bryobacter sp.]|nr:oxidative damage protection protein [Bryobacter sp.]